MKYLILLTLSIFILGCSNDVIIEKNDIKISEKLEEINWTIDASWSLDWADNIWESSSSSNINFK